MQIDFLLPFGNLILSLLAMLFSFYSIIYARRHFEATYFPRISLQVLEQGCGKSGLKTCLSFRLRNHSGDRVATDLKLQAALSQPILKWHSWTIQWFQFLRWHLWTIKWFQFFEQEHIDIPPELKKVTQPLSMGPYAEGLENFLVESFPSLVYRENDPNTPEEVAFKKEADFVLRVCMVYEAPILNAPNIQQIYYYRLTPKFHRNGGDQYCLYYWDIKFLKTVLR